MKKSKPKIPNIQEAKQEMTNTSQWFSEVEEYLMNTAGIDYQNLPNNIIDTLGKYENKIEPKIIGDFIIKSMNDKQSSTNLPAEIKEHIAAIKKYIQNEGKAINSAEVNDAVINILIEENIIPLNNKEPLHEVHGHGMYDRIIFPKMAAVSNNSQITRIVAGNIVNSFNERQKLEFIQWLNIVAR